MAGHLGGLLVELVAPALVVAWSPVKIVPALILVLNSARPKLAAAAFLAGSFVGLAAVTAVFIALPHLFDDVQSRSADGRRWAPVALVVGVILIGYTAYRWVRRGRVSTVPAWLSRFTRITPVGGAVLGTVLSIANFKVVAMNATAGVTISAAAVGIAGAALALTFYLVVASCTLIVPIVGYTLAAATVDRWLLSLRARIQRHQAAATTIVVAVLGIVLVAAGAYGLQ
ncbi:GAP family protein [Mycolicibacterium porcinum]|uniref:GAP family protein n=1 Tax=Mycolicibacterium porcinum TaxID=39693 RepID=UPI000848C149|nr:GAP family protein [Mycolicibacterium porcinum]ODR17766.1 hypothetical protein BHQ19_28220 [Mycolicibacterium porcinum]